MGEPTLPSGPSIDGARQQAEQIRSACPHEKCAAFVVRPNQIECDTCLAVWTAKRTRILDKEQD